MVCRNSGSRRLLIGRSRLVSPGRLLIAGCSLVLGLYVRFSNHGDKIALPPAGKSKSRLQVPPDDSWRLSGRIVRLVDSTPSPSKLLIHFREPHRVGL